MTVIVVCVMGIPGSGKSTLCEQLAGSIELRRTIFELLQVPCRVSHISLDAVEREIQNSNNRPCEFDPDIWRAARRNVLQTVEIIRAENTAPQHILVVLVDDTFHYRSMRKAVKPDGVIYLQRSFDACVVANRMRPVERQVPQHVMERMALVLEPPDEFRPGTARRLDVLVGEDLCGELVRDRSFWASICMHTSSEQVVNTQTVTVREKALNEAENKLRKIVSTFAQKGKIFDGPGVGLIKREAMARLKNEIFEDMSEIEMNRIICVHIEHFSRFLGVV